MIRSMRRRYARSQIPHQLVHRGNDRCCVFHMDEQRSSYLACLSHASRRYEWRMHAYVLMDNHVHILATLPSAGALSRMMQWTASRYTISFNESQDVDLERSGRAASIRAR